MIMVCSKVTNTGGVYPNLEPNLEKKPATQPDPTLENNLEPLFSDRSRKVDMIYNISTYNTRKFKFRIDIIYFYGIEQYNAITYFNNFD